MIDLLARLWTLLFCVLELQNALKMKGFKTSILYGDRFCKINDLSNLYLWFQSLHCSGMFKKNSAAHSQQQMYILDQLSNGTGSSSQSDQRPLSPNKTANQETAAYRRTGSDLASSQSNEPWARAYFLQCVVCISLTLSLYRGEFGICFNKLVLCMIW